MSVQTARAQGSSVKFWLQRSDSYSNWKRNWKSSIKKCQHQPSGQMENKGMGGTKAELDLEKHKRDCVSGALALLQVQVDGSNTRRWNNERTV